MKQHTFVCRVHGPVSPIEAEISSGSSTGRRRFGTVRQGEFRDFDIFPPPCLLARRVIRNVRRGGHSRGHQRQHPPKEFELLFEEGLRECRSLSQKWLRECRCLSQSGYGNVEHHEVDLDFDRLQSRSAHSTRRSWTLVHCTVSGE